VGTGSLLIPPAHFGAIVTGCDIDIRVIKGYSVGYSKDEMYEKNKINNEKYKMRKLKNTTNNNVTSSINPSLKTDKIVSNEAKSNIFTNFIHYKLPLPTILRADINYICFRKGEYFDMIICDPPYGHRAFTRKTGMTEHKRARREARLAKKYENFKKKGESKNKIVDKNEEKYDESPDDINEKMEEIDINTNYDDESIEKNEHPKYFSPLNQCSVATLFENLLNLGIQCLKVGGLLVCLYPTCKDKDKDGK
jgi:tRNA (guanine10-N2)-methyltransferase